jgi:hypothetical protein
LVSDQIDSPANTRSATSPTIAASLGMMLIVPSWGHSGTVHASGSTPEHE